MKAFNQAARTGQLKFMLSVRQSESPQTELRRLVPTSACTSSSNGFPAIQIRLDSEGCALKDSSSISLISRVGVMLRGRRIFLSRANGLLDLLLRVAASQASVAVLDESLPNVWQPNAASIFCSVKRIYRHHKKL
jgi:hypothetical protein